MLNKIMQNFVVIYKLLDFDNGILVFNIEKCRMILAFDVILKSKGFTRRVARVKGSGDKSPLKKSPRKFLSIVLGFTPNFEQDC